MKQAEGGIATEPQMKVGNFGTPPKRLLIIIISIIVAIVLCIFGYLYYTQTSGNNVTTKAITVCSVDTIKAASTAIDTNNSADLGKLKTKIVKLEDYTNDINCLYIVARYNLMITNTVEAQKYISLIEKKAPAATSYSKHFSTRPLTVQEMKEAISVIGLQAKEIESLQDANDRMDAAGEVQNR